MAGRSLGVLSVLRHRSATNDVAKLTRLILTLPSGPGLCSNWSFEGMIGMVNQAPPATTRRSRTRLVVQGVLSLVLEVAILGLLAAWNLCTYAFVWMSVTPGLGFWRAMVMTQATTAVANTVPAGSAIGIGMTYSMLGSWGFSRSRSTTAVLVSGVWNSFI